MMGNEQMSFYSLISAYINMPLLSIINYKNQRSMLVGMSFSCSSSRISSFTFLPARMLNGTKINQAKMKLFWKYEHTLFEMKSGMNFSVE